MKIYKPGDYFRVNGNENLSRLAVCDDEHKAGLIMSNGRFHRILVRVNDLSAITHEEVSKMTLYPFEYICSTENTAIVSIAPLSSPTYQPGQRFIICGGKYILAQVASSNVALISLQSGNRFHDPMTEVGNVTTITEEEMLLATGGAHYELID
jgi:hypothetical protein